jgi:hypothetical protein
MKRQNGEPLVLSNGYCVRLMVDSRTEGQYHVDVRTRRLLVEAEKAFNMTVGECLDKGVRLLKLRLALGIPKEHAIEEVLLWDRREQFELDNKEVTA